MDRDESSRRGRHIKLTSSLQFKYIMSYLAVFAVVLILLNTYPLIASENLLFSSKRDSLKGRAQVMASALMELETLSSSEQVSRVMSMLEDERGGQVLVTDPSGRILYDSAWQAETSDEISVGDGPANYALRREIVLAMKGRNDVFFTRYQDGAFYSASAVPIVYRGMTIGCVYVCEVDTGQGALLASLQKNLSTISFIIVAVAVVMGGSFSQVITSRIAALLGAIRVVGEGEYGHRLQIVGRDEMAELAEEFNQLTDRLQTTEEVRRRFVADASHELKTPLASIQLLTDSILQTDQMEPELVREFVTDIGSEAQRLTRITEHLLALTRLDSLPAAEVEPVDVSAVVEKVVSGLQPVAEEAGVTIRTFLPDGCIIPCTGDELYRIAYNLVENAIKYNLPGGEVRAEVIAQDDQIMLEVRDTGIGIPEADIPKVFNRFYRVDKARSRAKGGTGLGLSIVRDTVRRYGGWVTAAANSPEGSVFTVGFPRYEGEQEVEE